MNDDDLAKLSPLLRAYVSETLEQSVALADALQDYFLARMQFTLASDRNKNTAGLLSQARSVGNMLDVLENRLASRPSGLTDAMIPVRSLLEHCDAARDKMRMSLLELRAECDVAGVPIPPRPRADNPAWNPQETPRANAANRPPVSTGVEEGPIFNAVMMSVGLIACVFIGLWKVACFFADPVVALGEWLSSAGRFTPGKFGFYLGMRYGNDSVTAHRAANAMGISMGVSSLIGLVLRQRWLVVPSLMGYFIYTVFYTIPAVGINGVMDAVAAFIGH